MTKKNPQTEARWREAVKRQESSGISIREFCKQEGLHEPSFYAWRRELRLRDREAKVANDMPAQKVTANTTLNHGANDSPANQSAGKKPFSNLQTKNDSNPLQPKNGRQSKNNCNSGKVQDFVQLKLVDTAAALPSNTKASSLEIVHPLGCQIRVIGEINVDALRQVLTLLDQRGEA